MKDAAMEAILYTGFLAAEGKEGMPVSVSAPAAIPGCALFS